MADYLQEILLQINRFVLATGRCRHGQYCPRCGLSDYSQRAVDEEGLSFSADGKVDDRPLRLCAQYLSAGPSKKAETVDFDARDQGGGGHRNLLASTGLAHSAAPREKQSACKGIPKIRCPKTP